MDLVIGGRWSVVGYQARLPIPYPFRAKIKKDRFRSPLKNFYLTLFTFMRRSRIRRHMETMKVMMK